MIKKILLFAAILALVNAGAFLCLIKLSDRIEVKQPALVIDDRPASMIRVDKILTEYYGAPVRLPEPKELEAMK